MRAYAAFVYFASVTSQGTDVSFVVAKNIEYVPTTSDSSTPRALISSVPHMFDQHSQRQPLLQVNIKCFTDSQVALYWIHGVENDWKPFVKNHVTEIRDSLSPDCWSHCSGKTNPADLPSRGISLSELSVSKLWQCGPK